MKGQKDLGGGGCASPSFVFNTRKGVYTTPSCLGVNLIMILDPIHQEFLFVGSVFSVYHNFFLSC